MNNILELVQEYVTIKNLEKKWVAGEDLVQYAGPLRKIYDIKVELLPIKEPPVKLTYVFMEFILLQMAQKKKPFCIKKSFLNTCIVQH